MSAPFAGLTRVIGSVWIRPASATSPEGCTLSMPVRPFAAPDQSACAVVYFGPGRRWIVSPALAAAASASFSCWLEATVMPATSCRTVRPPITVVPEVSGTRTVPILAATVKGP